MLMTAFHFPCRATFLKGIVHPVVVFHLPTTSWIQVLVTSSNPGNITCLRTAPVVSCQDATVQFETATLIVFSLFFAKISTHSRICMYVAHWRSTRHNAAACHKEVPLYPRSLSGCLVLVAPKGRPGHAGSQFVYVPCTAMTSNCERFCIQLLK